jgi:uncharacterized protein
MGKDLYYRVSITAGNAAFDLSPDLNSLTIEEDNDKPDQLTIQMSDPFKVFSHALQEGMEVEVDLGTVEDHSLIFRGQIYRTEGNFPQESVPSLALVAYDRSMKMGLRKRSRPWSDLKLSEIVTTIAGEYFAPGNIEVNLKGDPSFTGNGIRQQNETDLAFLFRLAARYDCETFVVADESGDTLHFIAQYHIMQAEPEITLYHGRSGVPNRLLNFEATADVSDIQLSRVFSGMEYETGEPVEPTTAPVEAVGSTQDPFLDENLAIFRARYPDKAAQLQTLLSGAGAIQAALRADLGGVERQTTPGFTSSDELGVRAENQFSTSLHGMRGSGTALGNHRIRAQASMLIADAGGRFSGTWYLSQVRHLLDAQGYQTEFQCQR